MKRLGAMALATTLLAGAAVPAEAQERRRERRDASEPSITLFEEPNFEGRSLTFYADAPNLADQRFNDRARSARINGMWRLCGDRNFGSRCEPFAGDVRDFGALDFSNQISSMQQVGGRIGRPGFEGPAIVGRPAAGRDAVEGRTVVFFRRPSVGGVAVAAQGSSSAEAFCRTVGLQGGVVYFDETERSREAVDSEGRVHRNAPVLRDVLCRR